MEKNWGEDKWAAAGDYILLKLMSLCAPFFDKRFQIEEKKKLPSFARDIFSTDISQQNSEIFSHLFLVVLVAFE